MTKVFPPTEMLLNISSLGLRRLHGAIHIGAHNAEELEDYLKKGIRKILWVEANPDRYDEILRKISPYDEMFLGRFAAGALEGAGMLNKTSWTGSSSMLELGTHAETYPEATVTEKQEVPIKTVDAWIDENEWKRSDYNYLSLDIQGYELEALRGMTKQLRYIDYIYTEVNTQEVYKCNATIQDIDLFLGDHGYTRVATRILRFAGWGDALYARKYITRLRLWHTALGFLAVAGKIKQRYLTWGKSNAR